MSKAAEQDPFLTRIPARLDRLPWSRFHWLVVAALGITWILDGLEVTLKGAVSGVLQQPGVMGFSPAQIGSIASAYLAGAVLGALVFGYLTDRWGRKKLFSITLGVYLLGVLLTALSWNLASFALFRFLTGAGIGGEYAAINSAIDELIPAKHRGRIDLIVNGSYWIGAALGSGATLVILDPKIFPPFWGWRVGFGIGAVIGLFILLLRKFVPESPRWLMTHGRREEAEAVMRGIEISVENQHGKPLEPAAGNGVLIHPGRHFGFGAAAKSMLGRYKKRSALGFALMISQAFLYNAIFFTYALVLTKFYNVPPESTGL
ncbi:MAG: MFS transporter, partial [Elusimicrobia bacterium]|nr:MFS transporter [Elusimicrobiota bacterium]